MVLSLTEQDGTVTTWKPVAYNSLADTDWVPVAVNEPGQVGATTFVADPAGTGRVVRIIAAVPPDNATPPGPAVTCSPTGTLVKGCRALDLTYATVPAGSGTATRVTAITSTLWNPEPAGGGAMATTPVATYTYDASGRLASVTDPRSGLGTQYTWVGSTTRLATVKGTGTAAYQLDYDTTPATPRVAALSQDNPAGTGSPVTLARYSYAVPLSGAGLPDLTSDEATDPVNLWYQNSTPQTGYAVFGMDYTGPVSGSGTDWSRAALQYADGQGYTVNTGAYGAGAWQVSATDYNELGNITRQLDPGATNTTTAAAASTVPLEPAQVDALSTQTVYNANIEASVDDDGTGTGGPETRVVTAAGTLVTDEYGPTRDVVLTSDEGGDGVDDTAPMRPHTHTTYDQGAPTSPYGVGIDPITLEPYRLPTTTTVGAVGQIGDPEDAETYNTTTNGYAKLNTADTTEGDPWTLGSPTTVTTALTGGNITRTTRYDTEGRATETRQPKSTGSDAGTTRMLTYTAGTNPALAACGGKPEWAGLTCATLPAAAPSSGPTLPSSQVTEYSMWLQPRTVEETSGAATRTTNARYDQAGRPVATWTTAAGVTGSVNRPGTFTHYDTNGRVDYGGLLNAARDDAETTGRLTSTYDAWGRTITSLNSLGDTTTTSYVQPGQPGAGGLAAIIDDPSAGGQPNQTTTYGYDGTDADGTTERRGLVTTLTVTRAGAAGGSGTLDYAAAYDDQANLVTQKLPGQITQRTVYDEAGEPRQLTYTGTVQPVAPRVDGNGDPVLDNTGQQVYDPDGPALPDQPWLTWTVAHDTQGRVRAEATGPAAAFDGNPGVTDPADITSSDIGQARAYDRTYQYDTAGRLATVADQSAPTSRTELDTAPCKVRTYAFDTNGRRTNLSQTTHPDGDCASTTDTTTTSTNSDHYDTADRPTTGTDGTSSYVYDLLGRQTTLPAIDAPNPTAGPITLGYYDDDLPASVTQGGTSTTFTLDAVNRRLQSATTTGAATTTTVRHYTDASDNPAWTDVAGTITRHTESIGGDLGATLHPDGTAARVGCTDR